LNSVNLLQQAQHIGFAHVSKQKRDAPARIPEKVKIVRGHNGVLAYHSCTQIVLTVRAVFQCMPPERRNALRASRHRNEQARTGW
jgi:hypothetical protein